MPPPKRSTTPATTATADYRHEDTRLNNPPAGLADVNPLTPAGKKTYSYDPRFDPQLVWAGKAEHTSFEIETVPLYIHERVAPAAIINALQSEPVQPSLFADPEFDLNQAVEFYQHPQPWTNRLVLGDSLLVMNSLLERELLAGKVQCIYFDPPYGIKYSSNFQPFVNKRDVKDGDDGSLTRQPEQIRAFRDTWELGIHSYLTYIRDRLLLMRELLNESGSIFVQISDDNLDVMKSLLGEVFGRNNFVVVICYRRLGTMIGESIQSSAHYILWYAKNKDVLKHRKLFEQQVAGIGTGDHYTQLEEQATSIIRPMRPEEKGNPKAIPEGWRPFQLVSLATGGYRTNTTIPYEFAGKVYHPGANKCWRTTKEGLARLSAGRRIVVAGNTLRYKQYLDDFPLTELTTIWEDTARDRENYYVVQTPASIITRCILMTTDPGDLVFDPTSGSGTTAYVAEQWGRRWITCDTSRVALALARQRLMTATFPMYRLAHREQGVKGAFVYKTVPHITLKSIAQNEPPDTETLYDQPEIERGIVRVAGPFTVEAVQPPALDPDTIDTASPSQADDAASYLERMVEQLRRSGLTIRAQHVPIGRIVPLIGGVLHAEADYIEADKSVTAGVLFGPQYGPLTSDQLQSALGEARGSYSALIACGFAFDAPAHALMQKSNLRPPIIGVAINADLLMDGLLKTSKTSQVFSVFGKPDVQLSMPGPDGYTVTVRGVDIYDPNTGDLDATSAEHVAAWFLDTDYDGATFLVRQAYFPSQSPNPWERISKALKGSVDLEQFAALQRTTSLPFKAGKHKQCAVKVIDLRGNEAMTVLRLQ